MVLSNILPSIDHFIDAKSKDKYYEYKLALLLFLSACFFSTPNVFLFYFQDTLPSAWDTVILKSEELTNNLSHIESDSWQAKKVFRLSIPLLIKLFHLPPYIVIAFQILIGYLTFLYSYKLTFSISKNSVQSTLFTAGIAFIYFGKAALFGYYYAWFDGFSFFFLIMAMWSRNMVGLFLFSTLAAWNDERAFIALVLVFLFHLLESNDAKRLTIGHLVHVNMRALFVLISILAYVGLRLILNEFYGMDSPLGGVAASQVLAKTYPFLRIGLLSFFEGYWLLLVAFFGFLIMNKDYWRLVVLLFPLAVLILGSFCVTDITRSGSFAFPIVFLAIRYLKDKLTEQQMNVTHLACLVVSSLIPPFFICADWDIRNMLPSLPLFSLLEYLAR